MLHRTGLMSLLAVVCLRAAPLFAANPSGTPTAEAGALQSRALPRNVESNLETYYKTAATVTTPASPGPPGGPPAKQEKAKTGLRQPADTPLQIDDSGRVLVSIWTKEEPVKVRSALEGLGAEIVNISERHRLIEAWVDPLRLPGIASQDGVLSVTPIYQPILHAGSVQTQGDGIIGADVVRALGDDGAPFLIGALSDSALNLSGSQSTGDLPAVVDRYLEFPALDEGRAMLEIIHDIAPGARLAHHSAILSELSFADGIRKLAAAGARVIVDDVLYLSEPFFQDGIIAQAVDEVVGASGVTYVSAAGNFADLSYESDFQDNGSGFHDFDPSAGSDTRQDISFTKAITVRLVLQWDDPFYTTSGVTHNFDVKVYNASNTLVARGVSDNVATQQPLEVVAWSTSAMSVYQVEIQRAAGAGPSHLKYLLTASPDSCSIGEYATSSGTVVGHAAGAGAIAVGAVPFFNPVTVESFSSVGDATIYFDADGTRLSTPVARPKPDLVAPDNVNTTFFGRDIPEDSDTTPNFAGTSAAAPHVAGVAALILDANPHLTRSQVYDVLTSGATDLGAPGRDRVYGAGLVNADAARSAALIATDVTAPTAQLASPISVHGWDVDHVAVQFSEPLDAATANMAGNYELREGGSDQLLGTADDVFYTTTPSYDDAAQQVTLRPASPSANLTKGRYRITLHSGGGVTDPAGNPLNGGADSVFEFSIGHKSSIVEIEGGNRLALQRDGTTTLVYPYNPVLARYKWPQVMVGQLSAGGVSLGPFRSIPTDIHSSFRVENPDIAMNDLGGVVVYSDYEVIIPGAPDIYDMAFQSLDRDARAVGSRQVAAGSDGGKFPRVDMNESGDFAITWPSQCGPGSCADIYYVYSRVYDRNGVAKGAPRPVSQQDWGERPVVAIAANGNSTYAWQYFQGYDGSGASVSARFYDAGGSPLGGESQVNTSAMGDQSDPEIAVAQDGSLVVVWSTSGSGETGVFLQRFGDGGSPLGGEVAVWQGRVNPNVYGPVTTQAQVAMAPDGRFVVVWCHDDDYGKGVFAQRFAADGSVFGNPIWISERVSGDQTNPRVGMRANGDFVVTWTDSAHRARWVAWDTPPDARPTCAGKSDGTTCDAGTDSPHAMVCVSGACQQCTSTSASPRFVDNGDGTVTDRQTCLVWEKSVLPAEMRSPILSRFPGA